MIYYKALNAEGSKSDLESSTASKILTRCVVQGGRAGCVCILIMYHSRLPLTRCRLHDTIWTKDNDNRTISLPHCTFFSFSFLTLVLYDGWCFSGLQSSVSRQAYCDFVETIHYGDTEAGQSSNIKGKSAQRWADKTVSAVDFTVLSCQEVNVSIY